MPRINKNILKWEELMSSDNMLSSVVDNYKVEQAKGYKYKGEIVPKDPLDIAKANRKNIEDKITNYAVSASATIGGAAAIYLGYAALAAGPTGWALYGAYALAAAGSASIAAGAINHMNEGQWDEMLHALKLKLGHSGAMFNDNLRKFYEQRIQDPLIETARTLMSNESSYTAAENREMKDDRDALVINIDKMLSKEDTNFASQDLPLGHQHFIKAACDFQKMMQDMIYINKNKAKGFEPSILSEKLAQQFGELAGDKQDGIIRGYLANFIASLTLVKEAVSKNTQIKGIQIREKEGCSIS